MSELLGPTMRDLGIPSVRVTGRVERAWKIAAQEEWLEQTNLLSLRGGVLEVGVASAALRDELTNFHRERVLAVLRAALPDVPLIGVRFTTDIADRKAT